MTPRPSGAALPAPVPWTAAPLDVSPAVKRRAVEVAEALTRWAPGQGGLAAHRSRLAAIGVPPGLADAAVPLLPATRLGATTESTSRIVDAQYGGILSSTSSVLVVVQQWVRVTDGSVRATGTTFDIRLSAASPRWIVTAVHPAQPGKASTAMPALARAVLENQRLHLPVAARADVASGTISAGVLSALQTLSRSHVLDVSVIRSGHPLDVFGTTRPSDHPRGHAVDIWAVDGSRVVDLAGHPKAFALMRAGIAAGAYQAGGPVDLDGAGSQFFSDNTHHDHVHLGFHS